MQNFSFLKCGRAWKHCCLKFVQRLFLPHNVLFKGPRLYKHLLLLWPLLFYGRKYDNFWIANAVSYRTEIFCHVRAVLLQKRRILRKLCCAKFSDEPSISLKWVKASGILLDGWLFFHHFTSHLLLLSFFYIQIECRLPKIIF